MSSDRDDSLERSAARAYRDAARDLDPATSAALARARREALAGAGRVAPAWWAAPVALTTGAAAIAVGLVMTRQPVPSATPLPVAGSAAEVEILLADESLDMIEELEFYLWLETEPDTG